MSKIKFLIFIFCLLSFSSVSANPDRNSEIEEEVSIGGQDVSQLKSEIDRLEQEIQRLQQEQDQYRKNISGTQAQAKSLQNEINNLTNQVKYLENQVNLTSFSINKTSTEISEAEKEIYDTQEHIDVQKKAVARAILFLDRQDNETLLVSLLKNENISDFLRQEQYANSLNASLVDLIEDLKSSKNELERYRSRLESKKGDLENLKQRQSQEKHAVSLVRAETSSILKTTKGKEAEYQKMLNASEELERAINLEVFKLEDQLRRTLDPTSVPSGRLLDWPVRGNISQKYGCLETNWARRYYPDCNKNKGGFHNGLDIAAPYGTPLRAADDGKVIAVGKAPAAYGIWLAIEHSHGLVTAYTHMSVRALNVGQKVKRGDIVGDIGSTGFSTGSHIHFMVYAPKTFTIKNSSVSGTLPIGATLNPLDFL